MSITREQVADLREGDVVEYRRDEWPEGAVVRAPLERGSYDDTLYVLGGHFGVVGAKGAPYDRRATLTVVSRAPRSLYVNHSRTSPVPGDVVRDADSDDPLRLWITTSNEDGDTWWVNHDADWCDAESLPTRLRLLVDGETGEVVP